jgi:hypothetical protein
MMAGMGLPALAQAETLARPPDRDQPSRTHTVQISEDEARAARDKAAGKAYLDNATATPPPPARPDLMQTEGDQISQGSGKAPASQITDSIERSPSMAQLSRADLDATLAQLSAAERRVLLQAIEGTDICDNPPNVAAVITLCQSRLETRSVEFAARPEPAFSAEEQLLRGNFENAGLPSVAQVIERLSRTSAATDNFSNQAIASIALTQPASAPAGPGEEQGSDALGLSSETQALINAIVNQLGGAGGSP